MFICNSQPVYETTKSLHKLPKVEKYNNYATVNTCIYFIYVFPHLHSNKKQNHNNFIAPCAKYNLNSANLKALHGTACQLIVFEI